VNFEASIKDCFESGQTNARRCTTPSRRKDENCWLDILFLMSRNFTRRPQNGLSAKGSFLFHLLDGLELYTGGHWSVQTQNNP